jgi:hypothetical protein
MSAEATTELAVVERLETKLSASASIEEIGARLALVKRALQESMEENIDYGKIPGCGPKPGLLKPGAEKLKTLFQLGFTVKEKEVRDLGDGHREVEITLQFTHLPTGWVMGDGLGSANTRERRMQREKGTPADVYNNCLKIAKKRALVDGILTVTGSSGLLTQDIEEDPDLYRDTQQPERQPLPRAPKQNGNGNHGKPELVKGTVERTWRNEYQGRTYWFAKIDGGRQLQTTDEALGEQLLEFERGNILRALAAQSPKPGKYYVEKIVTVEAETATEFVAAQTEAEATSSAA